MQSLRELKVGSPRDRGAVGRESTMNGMHFDAVTVQQAVDHELMHELHDGELVDMSRFPNLRKAARHALGRTVRFSSNYTNDRDLGYDCSNLWDKSNYRVVDDKVEFGVRMRNLLSQLAAVHLDDIPSSEVEATLRATNGHVGRAMQQLHPMVAHPPPDSVRKEIAVLTGQTALYEKRAIHDKRVLPESVVQKIEELPEEKTRNRILSIRQKFKLIDTDGNGTLDIEEFYELCANLNLSKEQLHADFVRLDADKSGSIDFEEFLSWWKERAKESQEFSDLFDDIGRKEGDVKISTPDVRPTTQTQHLQVQKFFNAGLRGRKLYHIEVVGTRLSVFRSRMDRDEKTRLQLTDEEIIGAYAIPRDKDMKTGFEIEVLLGGKTHKIEIKFDGEGKLANIRQLDSWVGLVNLAINHRHENRSGEELWSLARTRAPLIKDVVQFLGNRWMGFDTDTAETEDTVVEVTTNMTVDEIEQKRLERLQMQELASQQGNIYSEPILPWGMRHPNSKFSMVWDVLQIIFLLTVCYFVPVRTCFQLEVELWSAEFWWDVVVDFYFILDLIINFRTAIYDGKKVLVTDGASLFCCTIERMLICTKANRTSVASVSMIFVGLVALFLIQFLIDFLSCLPVGYIGYISTDTMAGGGLDPGVLKSLRLLRLGKMMRLAKLYRTLKKYEDFQFLKPFIGLATLLGIVVLAAHMLACFWFLIGSSDQRSTELDPETGMPVICSAERAAGPDADCTEGQHVYHYVKGWVAVYEEEEGWWGPGGLKTELGTRYATSMYLIFNGLENGYTDTEKYFAIFSELIVSSLIYGGMAALMTESLTEANEAEKDFNERFSALKAWMTERRLQKSYINKVLNYYSHKYKDSVIYDQAELLKELPPAMAASLMKELYGEVVAKIPFFHDLDDVVITKLSALAKPLKVHQGQPIIEEGKTGLEMYILIEGECLVEKGGIQLGILNIPGSYFGEMPIVNSRDRQSETRQRTVKAVTDCDLIYLDQEDVHYLAERNPALKERLVRFSRLGKRKTKTKFMAEDWAREHSYGIKGVSGQDKMTTLLNALSSKRWGEVQTPQQSPVSSGGLVSGNGGAGGQVRADAGGASADQLAELFQQFERKVLQKIDQQLSTEVSKIHQILAAQQQNGDGDGGDRETLMPDAQHRP